MIPVAAAPPIIIFIFMALVLCYKKVGDILNIPRSRLTYARIIVKDTFTLPRSVFTTYRAIFEYGNFQTIELAMPKKVYRSISVGSRGVLVHTDSRFRGFHVDKKIPDIIKPKKNKRKKSKGWR